MSEGGREVGGAGVVCVCVCMCVCVWRWYGDLRRVCHFVPFRLADNQAIISTGLLLASSPGHSFFAGGRGGGWPGYEVGLVHACGASVEGELVT